MMSDNKGFKSSATVLAKQGLRCHKDKEFMKNSYNRP